MESFFAAVRMIAPMHPRRFIFVAVSLLAPAAAAAAPTERRLHSDAVEASSFLWNDWNRFQENYHPNYVADDDPRTAWTEGAATTGAGEWIRVHVSELAGTSRVRLKIRNGYQKSPSLFAANARAKGVVVRLLPSGAEHEVTLTDASGWQEVAVEQPAGPLEAVELRATSVYEGTRYTDLCLSDVQVFATSTARENPSFERDKRRRLLDWKEARVKSARLFGKAAGKELPLRPAYQRISREAPPVDLWQKCESDWRCQTREALALATRDAEFRAAHGALIAVAMEAAADEPVGFLPARVAPAEKRRFPVVDELEVPELYNGLEGSYGYGGFELPALGLVAALRGETLRAIELRSKVTLAAALEAKAPGCATRRGATYLWMKRARPPGEAAAREVLRAMISVQCAEIEVRDGTTEAAQYQVLVYGDDGNLGLVAGPGYVNGFRWTVRDGRPLLDGGQRVSAIGNRDQLTAGALAQATPKP